MNLPYSSFPNFLNSLENGFLCAFCVLCASAVKRSAALNDSAENQKLSAASSTSSNIGKTESSRVTLNRNATLS